MQSHENENSLGQDGMSCPNEKAGRSSRSPFLGVVVLLWALCLLWYWIQPSPQQVESLYSRGLYRVITYVVVPLTSAVPFSIMTVLLITAPLVFIALWVANWIYRRRVEKLPHWRGFMWGLKWLLATSPILWMWFLLFWGIGYSRLPVEKRLNLDSGAISESDLLYLKEQLFEVILRDQPQRPEDRDVDRALQSISRAMRQKAEEWEGKRLWIPHRVKATLPGMLLLNGTSGICTPFTLEPHVDGGLPDTAFVSVGAHELAHIAGVCDEGETNLVGFISGLHADDPYARYAVALDIYVDIAGQLGSKVRAEAIDRLPEQARNDLKRAREAYERYRIAWLQKWSWRAYNHYLKSQGVQEGVKSYGRGTQLLARAWRAGYLPFPVPEPPLETPEQTTTDIPSDETPEQS